MDKERNKIQFWSVGTFVDHSPVENKVDIALFLHVDEARKNAKETVDQRLRPRPEPKCAKDFVAIRTPGPYIHKGDTLY